MTDQEIIDFRKKVDAEIQVKGFCKGLLKVEIYNEPVTWLVGAPVEILKKPVPYYVSTCTGMAYAGDRPGYVATHHKLTIFETLEWDFKDLASKIEFLFS